MARRKLKSIKSRQQRQPRIPKGKSKSGLSSEAVDDWTSIDLAALKLTPAEQKEAARFRKLTLKRATHRAAVVRLIAKLREGDEDSKAA